MLNYVKAILFPLWLIASAAMAQTHISGTGHTPVPRMSLHRKNVLRIEAGKTFTFPPSTDVDVIEIAGTAKVSRTAATTIKATDIQVLEGGTLDIGTETDPVTQKVEVIFKDTPLLTGTDGSLGVDPEQFGNGLVVFGQFTSHGRKLDRTFNTFAPTAKGATQITLTVPCNWQVGDDLKFHDTTVQYFMANRGLHDKPVREESPVTIKSLSGQTVTLSKPLDFEHSSVFGVLPYVANATRNIVFRSETANATTRGHLMFMDKAHVSLYYTSFIDLGRTLPKNIDNFNSNSLHIGTNQIARYAVHWHNVHGHSDWGGFTGRAVGNYLHGSDVAKWGMVQHGTHDLLVQDNVAYHFVGACFITEDGYEVRGKYLNNLGAYCQGNGFDGKANLLTNNFAPGAEGSPFWFHGSQHTLEGNVALCSAVGYGIPHRAQVFNRSVPSMPGGANDTPLNPVATKFISTKNNIAWSCKVGVETWNVPVDWYMDDLTVLNSANMGIFMGNGESGFITLRNSKLLNDNAGADPVYVVPNIYPHEAIHSSAGYTGKVTLDNVEIEGFHTGILDAAEGVFTKGGRIKTRGYDVNWGGFLRPNPFPLVIDGTKLEGTYQKLLLGSAPEGTGTALTSNKRLLNWQGTGKNYYLFGIYETPPGATKLEGVVGVVIESDKPTPPVDPPPPPTNRAPEVAAITISPPPPIYDGMNVSYTAAASDLDGDELSYVASMAYEDTPEIILATGTGNFAEWSVLYNKGPRAYIQKIKFSDGKTTSERTLVVNVLAKPVDPPTDLENLQKKLKELTVEIVKYVEFIEALRKLVNGFMP